MRGRLTSAIPMKPIALVALALCAGLGLWWFSRAGDGGTTPSSAKEAARTPQVGLAERSSLEPELVHEPALEGVAIDESRLPLAESSRESSTMPLGTNERALEVLVRRKGSDEPIAGALVRWLEFESVEADVMSQLERSEVQIEAVLEAYGSEAMTDSAGRVRVPELRDGGCLSAAREDSWGMRVLSNEEESPVVLEIQEDPPVVVRVVDGHGEPCGGVPVVLRVSKRSRSRDGLRAASAERTGLARLEHPRTIAALMEAEQLSVGLALLVAPPIEAPLDLAAIPREPIELVVPPLAGVDVRIRAFDGSPFSTPATVTLDLVEAEKPIDPAMRRRLGAAERSGTSVGGLARFDLVGLGLEVAAVVQADGFEPAMARGFAPSVPGERAELVVQMPPRAPTLVGRALHPGGQPLAGERLQSVLAVESPRNRSARNRYLVTEADGTFRLPVDPAFDAEEGRCTFEIAADGSDGRTISAQVEVPLPLSSGDVELGDLLLELPPLIVAGSVVSSLGTPISNAQITVLRQVGVDDPGGQVLWTSVQGVRGTSGPEGRFEVRGRIQAREIAVAASHRDYVQGETTPIAFGAPEVRLELEKAGSVAIRVLVDEGIERNDLQFSAASIERPERTTNQGREGDDTVLLGGLVPGMHRVQCRLVGDQVPILELDDVLVQAGETTRDPRLDPLDLRGRLRMFTLEASDESGAPVVFGLAARRSGFSSRYAPMQAPQREPGRVRIVTSHGPLDLLVSAPGLRDTQIDGVDGDRSIVMLAGLPVRIHFVGGVPLLEKGESLTLSVRSESGQSSGGAPSVRVDERGLADCSVGAPGTYAVTAWLSRNDGSIVSVQGGERSRIEVDDRDSLQEYEIVVTADDLVAARLPSQATKR